jgi:hypothetical protein
MSWTKDNNGTWVWTPDGKGNPNKAGDNVTPLPPRPSFDMGTGSTGSESTAYTVDVGFGLVDTKGNPLALPPIQIGSYITTLAGKDPKAFARVKAAVAALTGRKTLDPSYVGGYVSKLAQNIMGSSDLIAKSGSIEDYFSTAIKNSGATTVASPPQSYVSSATQAKGDINKIFGDLLGRQASEKELKALTSILNDAQKKNPSKYVDGVTYGGLDKEQFLIDLVTTGKYDANPKASPIILTNIAKELNKYQSTIQQQGAIKIEDTLKGVADANGISLSQSQIDAYKSRLKAGEDINLLGNDIRKIASLGQPDAIKKLMESGTDLETIYTPYKSAMAASLGINPRTITLDDPTLRMAIGPDKEMSLYEYKKAIRQDKRWPYSQEANDEVTNMINQVKRDFGFMG